MDRRLARTLLAACLRVWPSERRRRHGDDLLEAALRLLADARVRGRVPWVRELAGEAAALVREGLRLRIRDGWTPWVGGWILDFRASLRGLRRRPVFTVVGASTLALGLGGAVALFSLADSVLLRPPPYERPEELALVWGALPDGSGRIPLAGPDAALLDEHAGTLDRVAFSIRGVDGALAGGPDPVARHVRIAAVTSNFFATLGVSPALGLAFDPTRTPGEGASSALISHDLWTSALGGDPSVVGSDVRINGRPVQVRGVLPRGFTLALPPDAGILSDVDVWLPLTVPLTAFHRTEDRLLDRDSDNTGAVVARLAPGTDPTVAGEEVRRVGRILRDAVPAYAEAGLELELRPLMQEATAHARPVLLPVLAGVLAVLVVATLNLAILLLARGAGRARELAVRRALGAGRLRIVRGLVVESLLLAGLGLGCGILLAQAALAVADLWVPAALLPPEPPGLDLRSLAFGASLAAAVALLGGVLPGMRRADGDGILGERGASEATGGSRARQILVGAEVALSLALLLGTGLLLRTVGELRDVRPGFEPDSALAFRVSLRVPDVYRAPADRAAFMAELTRELEELPGVRAAGLVGILPLEARRWTQPWGRPGEPPESWTGRADFRTVTSGAFQALGTRILEGRGFLPREDVSEEERVVVVDSVLAARLAPGGSAVGATVGIPLDGAPVEARVVGVVEAVRYERLDGHGPGAVYVPYRQEASREVAFVVRAADARALVPQIRQTVATLDPAVPVYEVQTLDSYVSAALAPRTFALSVLAGFAVLALLCAAGGLYGVVAFDVRRRRRAIGVRLALGATPSGVVRCVVASMLPMVGPGLLVGAALGAVSTRSLESLTFGVSAGDPVVWAGAVGVVVTVTLAATLVPARAASRLDATEALRAE